MTTKLPSSPELTFDPEGHKYWLGKKRIPSVSEILSKVGLSKNYEGIDPFYAARGTATHLAIQFHLQGKLDRESLDPVVVPHFEAFLKFWGDREERIEALEKPLCDLSETFAGTPDLVTNKAIYDWKCSKSHDRVAELQGQAYKILAVHNRLNLNNPVEYKPFIVVELHDDGSYETFDYGLDYEQWASVMDLWRWKTKK